MIRIEAQGPTTVSAGGTTRIVQSREQAVSIPEQRSADIGLEDLIGQLKAEVPGFEQEFKKTGRELAPLAETDDGGVTVTSLRVAVGLTQKAFAEAINWRQPNVSAMEAGQRSNPNRETMHAMCNVLGCDMNTLDQAIENSKKLYDEHIAKQERAAARIKLEEGKSAA